MNIQPAPIRLQYMRLRVACLALLSCLILACGGGAGGVGGSTFTYVTDWTLRTSPGGGLSQRLTFLDDTGKAVKSFAAERHSEAEETYHIEGVPSGSFVLKIELFSETALQGVNTGILQAPVTVGANSSYKTAVGATSSAVKLLPEQADVQVPESARFYAVASDASGTATFTPPGGFNWQVSGGIGNVSSDGVLLTSHAGNGSVKATQVQSGSFDTSPVSVTANQPRIGKWTILVFLNAANDLYKFSDLNVDQMERAAGNKDVRFVVQWKQTRTRFPDSTFDGTRRYLVQADARAGVSSTPIQDMGAQVDMGNAATLTEFIDWAKTYYPAQRYGLVVWNHGNGWRRRPNDDGITRAVSYDDQTGNSIQIWDLNQALGPTHFDFIAWDASLMQMMEVAYEIRSHTDFVIGSEESPPGEGYPYDTILSAFRDNPDDPSRNLTKSFVDGMLGVSAYTGRKITQSVLDTNALPALRTSVDSLARSLIANHTELQSVIPAVRQDSQAYSQTTTRYYRDLCDVCERLEALSSNSSFKAACAVVRAKISSAVVWEGHNTHSPGSRGVAIDMSPGVNFLSTSLDYGRMVFARDTLWDDWLVTVP